MKTKLFLPILLSLLLFACTPLPPDKTIDSSQTPAPAQTSENLTTSETTSSAQTKTFTLDEISKHNSESDCWLLINKKVYDATLFISKHPGSKAILNGCGKDATTLFETRPMGSKTPHSEKARNMLAKYYIGDIQ